MRLVQMLTTIDDTEIVYEVIDGDCQNGDFSGARGVWEKTVRFGATDATVAGGHAFVEAAREQEAVAMRLRWMSDAEVVEAIRDRRFTDEKGEEL